MAVAVAASWSAKCQTVEPPPTDSLSHYELYPIVVLATRTPRDLRSVPEPIDIVTRDEISALGVTRLGDLLDAHGGATVVHAFGAGIQLQGLPSDYVLVLVDGEPVIGRAGGTLDLQRLHVADAERIELLRGPSSSLYGSDALAGVINVVTRTPGDGLHGNVRLHVEGNSTTDGSTSVSFASTLANASIGVTRYASSGYDLLPEAPGSTVPGFLEVAGNLKATLFPSGPHRFVVSARVADLAQRDDIDQSVPAGFQPISNTSDRSERTLSAKHNGNWTRGLRISESIFHSRFESRSDLGSEASRFQQDYARFEIESSYVPGPAHVLTAGGGGVAERVETQRIRGGTQSTSAGYLFAEYQWLAASRIEIIVSGRYDSFQDYESRLSPKVAGLVRVDEKLQLRLSLGSGFKAPTFQQRYLDFTNPLGGYTVVGSVDVAARLDELEEEGIITGYDPGILPAGDLRPEHSTSVNAGVDWDLGKATYVRVNLFTNRVRDLIETMPVADKVNGQQVFSYLNLRRIRTRGFETILEVSPAGPVSASVRYQYLDAFDQDIAGEIADGRIFKPDGGRDRTVRHEEYGGLFQRSKHSATLQVEYRHDRSGTRVALRTNFRGRYGLFDRNGNLILDDASEYASGYAVWNLTVTQTLGTMASLRAGVKNALDHTDPANVPSLPGRLFFGGLSIDL
jgi:outer membrane receptor for ferrienterochelin and colicins